MSKVVYLMGAGASYGKRDKNQNNVITEGIPVVNEINNELKILLSDLEVYIKTHQFNKKDGDNLIRLCENFKLLYNESSRHLTIDTYAKKIFLQDDIRQFDKLKDIISSFFMIMQLKYPIDKRYDAFLANILNYPYKKIPEEITILTWNYDSQFEIAYREFNDTENPTPIYWKGIRKRLGVKDAYDDNLDHGKIFKLNGTAMFDWFNSFSLLGEECGEGYENLYLEFADVNRMFKTKNHLHFAWETDADCSYLKEVYNHIHDAETLVVIGYTFPYFNRAIDRAIFDNLLLLKNIYIQDPYAERIIQNIKPVLSDRLINSNVKIIPLTDVDQFYLPREL